jgi:hypothetical protein
MKTEIGKYYIVYDDDEVLILDLGLQDKSNIIETKKNINVTNNEIDYNKFLDTLINDNGQELDDNNINI